MLKIIFSLALFLTVAVSASAFACEELLRSISAQPELRDVKLNSLADVMQAFSQGLVPNLKNKDQKTAFALYLATVFGSTNRKTQIPDVGFERSLEVLAESPELVVQPRFRNVHIEYSRQAEERMSPELDELTERLHRTARQSQSNFSQIEANIGFYRKLFRRPDLQPSDLRLEQTDVSERNLALFKVLRSEFDRQLIEEKTTGIPPVAKLRLALADLVHNASVLDGNLDSLKGSKSVTRTKAIKRILQQRDMLAIKLGFETHYLGLLKYLGVIGPTGVTKAREIETLSAKLAAKSIWETEPSRGPLVSRLVRHLGALEKPHRSCLGGSDCSSFSYFDFGFEPAAQYFTLTDVEGKSSGQITVVLGHLKQKGGDTIQAAFLDKVQNVPDEALLAMLEGVRVSLMEFGFPLYLGEDSGDFDSLSNDRSTTEIYDSIFTMMSAPIEAEFLPLPSKYKFDHGYSRAFGRALSFTPFRLPSEFHVQMKPGEIDRPWRIKRLPRSASAKSMLNLKNGDDVDKGKYFSLMPLIESAGLDTRANHHEMIKRWLADEALAVRLKGDILASLSERDRDYDPDDDSEDDRDDLIELIRQLAPILAKLPSSQREALANRVRALGLEDGDPECWSYNDVWFMALNWDYPRRAVVVVEESALWKIFDVINEIVDDGPEIRTISLETFRLIFNPSPDLMRRLSDVFVQNPKKRFSANLSSALSGNLWSVEQKLELLEAIVSRDKNAFLSRSIMPIAKIFDDVSPESYEKIRKALQDKKPATMWLPEQKPIYSRFIVF